MAEGKKQWKSVGVLYKSELGEGYYGFISPADWAYAAQYCEELQNGCIPISLFPNTKEDNNVVYNVKVGLPRDVQSEH